MLIKSAESKDKDLESLQQLLSHPGADASRRKEIEKEIKTIRSGEKGERDAAYEIDFHLKNSKNWAVIHDLRIEHEGRVAQIDHILVNRLLEVWVCESKRFTQGVAINEQGEWTRFFNGRPHGMPSPIEQNRKHATVLSSLFDDGLIEPPKRLGFYLFPVVRSMIVVSSNTHIKRPKTTIEGFDDIVKVDQFVQRILKSDTDLLSVTRIIGSDTLEAFATRIAATHTPVAFDWRARFGLDGHDASQGVDSAAERARCHEEANTTSRTSKLTCAACGTKVSFSVARFCWSNKARFSGAVYCIDCQKGVDAARR